MLARILIVLVVLVCGAHGFFGECIKKNKECGPLSHCCEDLQCYYDEGVNPNDGGICADCVEQGKSCWRDVQCCGHSPQNPDIKCNKKHLLAVDGTCEGLGRQGFTCYKDSQCAEGLLCQKALMYHYSGKCDTTWENGHVCFKNNQCQSNRCRDRNVLKFDFYGVCEAAP